MKTLIITVGFAIFLIATQNLMAQSPFMEEVELTQKEVNSEQWNKYKKLKENRKFKKVNRIKFNNLKKLQKEGKLKFKIPGQKQQVTAYPTYVNSIDEKNWEWNGELLDKNEIIVGTITMISEDEALFGSLLAYGEEYVLQDIGTDKKKDKVTLLIQHDAEVLTTTTCSLPEINNENEITEKAIKQLKSSCIADVRVLVLYTTKAYNTGISPNQVASTGISNMNQALRNSGITSSELTFNLAGVQRLNGFTESSNYRTDLNLIDNNETHRNNYTADLVICLTDGNYTNLNDSNFSVLGFAFINDNANSNSGKYGLVEIQAFNTNTFVHELGHLMGGRHECDIVGPNQLDCSYSGSNKSYSWSGCPANFGGGSHKTIMNHISSGAIPYFSNPSKPFNQCPTGTNNNNVTARILSNRCAVYNFNTNNSGFQVYINGPSYIYNSSQYFTWTPQVTSCNGSVTSYTWAYSTNGYSYTNFSYSYSASKRGNTFPYGYRTVFIKLTVHCSNGETATRVKPITNYSFYNYAVYNDTYFKSKSIQDNLGDDMKVVISPNPVRNSFQLELLNPREGKIRYTIINENGQIVKTDDIVGGQGIVHMKINTEEYPSGIYWIQVISEHEFQSHPLIIQN